MTPIWRQPNGDEVAPEDVTWTPNVELYDGDDNKIYSVTWSGGSAPLDRSHIPEWMRPTMYEAIGVMTDVSLDDARRIAKGDISDTWRWGNQFAGVPRRGDDLRLWDVADPRDPSLVLRLRLRDRYTFNRVFWEVTSHSADFVSIEPQFVFGPAGIEWFERESPALRRATDGR